jgi:hypothetical protein
VSERTLRVLLVVLSVAVGGVGGYVYGFGSGRTAVRGYEVAQDLVTPANDLRSDRMRRDGVRRVTRELAEFQARFHAERGRYAGWDSIPVPTNGYTLDKRALVIDWRPPEQWQYWGTIVRDERIPRGEHCAVILGKEPAYVGGIVLRRSGRVRCSWDLATRINGWLR